MKSIKLQLEELEKDRFSLEKWINDLESCVHFQRNVVEDQIEDCKVSFFQFLPFIKCLLQIIVFFIEINIFTFTVI